MVYENCRIYGPYDRNQDNRLTVVIVYPNGEKKTVSYPKYLMEVHLGRYLDEDETVDHLDGNPRNNNLDNLVIKPRKEHVLEDVKRLKEQEFICPWCGGKFKLVGARLSKAISNRKTGFAGPFCSKSCASKYGRAVQLGRMEKLEVKEIDQIYTTYKQEKAKRK